jgi:SAM-dependent methyltransferase
MNGEPPTYRAVNTPVLAEVPRTALRVLDIGCGSGALGRAIKESLPAEVTGLTASESEAAEARRHLDEVVVVDLETCGTTMLRPSFDTIVCSHVLEHLRDPRALLRSLKSLVDAQGTLIVALPNVLHWRQRLVFLKGDFKYSNGGLMDRTHLRFFDWDTARDLVSGSGWSIVRAYAVGHAPGVWRIPGLGPWLDKTSCSFRPNIFGDQFVIVSKPGPSASSER